MRRIDNSTLWIGSVRDGRDSRALFDGGLQVAVDLALEEKPTPLPRELAYIRLPLIDGSGNPPWLLRAAIDFTSQLVQARVPALVFCGAGMSRSPCIAATALALARGGNPDEFLNTVLASGPVDISPGLWVEAMDALHALRHKGSVAV